MKDDAGETQHSRLLAGPNEFNPSFIAEWEAMDPHEYAASLLDIPDHILDAAPEDDLPEHIRLAWHLADAARMPDPLTDPPGPGLAATLYGMADDELGDAGLIDRITGFERQAGWIAAGQARAVAELAKRRVLTGGEPELRFFVDELALALTCTRYAAWARLQTALDLLDRLPATLTALECGRICVARARVIAEGTRTLTDALARLVQDEVLSAAELLTPASLRARVAAAVAAVDPRGADEAHDDACAERTVRKYPREHGMTGIWALLPADHAAAVWAAVTTHAEATREPGDDRTADQRRADSLTQLMIGYLDGTCPADQPGTGGAAAKPPSPLNGCSDRPGAAGRHGSASGDNVCRATGQSGSIGTESADGSHNAADPPEPPTSPASLPSRPGCRLSGGHRVPRVPAWCRVQVKVSADWLLGRSTEAPTLSGYGPLPAEVALRLIADAGWQRIVYDPLTGALLEAGCTVHDPPPALREHVLVRDGGCTQPICSSPRVDLDHNIPFPHGPTSATNLRSRCRHHHRLKQHPHWQAKVRPDGGIDWIAPTGHAYPEHQPDLRPGPSGVSRRDPDVGPDNDSECGDPSPGAADLPPF